MSKAHLAHYYRDSLVPFIGMNVNLSGTITGFRPGCGYHYGMYCIKPVFMNGKYITHHIWFPNTSLVQEFAVEKFNGRIPEKVTVKLNCYIDEYRSTKKIDNVGIKFINDIYLIKDKNYDRTRNYWNNK